MIAITADQLHFRPAIQSDLKCKVYSNVKHFLKLAVIHLVLGRVTVQKCALCFKGSVPDCCNNQ